MDNLISIFMNYKTNRLIEYGLFVLGKDTPFIRQVFKGYFGTYVDNYYYGIFHTIEDTHYNEKNLKLEFKGIMEEMLDDYRALELQVSNTEYNENRKIIEDLNAISFEVVKIDGLEFQNKEEIASKVSEFVQGNKTIREMINGKDNQLIRMIKETYQTNQKLLNYEDNYYHTESYPFHRKENITYYKLIPNIKVLEVYRKNMVNKIYSDDKLSLAKLECMIQKISLEILKKTLNHEKITLKVIDFYDDAISRGKIRDSIFDLMDNPLFQRYVVLGVNYNLYQSQETAFSDDFQFACIQDFTHINDIYQKTESIIKDGIFNYLFVSDCRYLDRDYFLNYEGSNVEILMLEEE